MDHTIDIEDESDQEDEAQEDEAEEENGQIVDDDCTSVLLRNGFVLFIMCSVIASIVCISIVATYNHVMAVPPEVYPDPFRVVTNGIWSGYRHEFFKERVPYMKAKQICLSRNKASILYFKSQDQEDKFDMYATLNFWSETEYPAFQLWTSGLVLSKRMNRTNFIIWPEPTDGELQEIRTCGIRDSGGQINAFGVSAICWQERHIIKDYIRRNQPEAAKVGSDSGCWQLVKRNDIAPDVSYQFVCQRKI